jgi:two-component system response regulator HydG
LPKVAQSNAPVLITGETGTGKERVAEAIHELSRRRNAAFVAVNCAALPEELIEAELFGYEKGAFTGAAAAHSGRAAQADGGTLFLDEIGEMTSHAQAKLLRFLQCGTIDRIGAKRPIKVDVRIVAATNQSLEEMIQERRFRSDLYYRLNVARMEIEPLRNRPADIAVLVEGFLDEFNRRDGCRVGPPDESLLKFFKAYDWPGNVRELRNVIEAIFIDPPSRRISLADLPPAYRRMMAGHRVHVPTERDRLIAALQRTNWNKAEAARTLKMSRMTIYRKIAKYDLVLGPRPESKPLSRT